MPPCKWSENMARKSSKAVKIVRVKTPVMVRQPRNPRASKAMVRATRSRGLGAVKLREEKHALTAIVAAGVLGLIESKSPESISALSIGPLKPAATLGIGAWLLNRFSKNKTLEHAATGLLSVAAYDLAKTGIEGEGDWNEGE